jgi:hypothetical protein
MFIGILLYQSTRPRAPALRHTPSGLAFYLGSILAPCKPAGLDITQKLFAFLRADGFHQWLRAGGTSLAAGRLGPHFPGGFERSETLARAPPRAPEMSMTCSVSFGVFADAKQRGHFSTKCLSAETFS